MTKIENIISTVKSLSETLPMLVFAIDGMPGGGKSTLTKHLLRALPEMQVIKTDSFFDFNANQNDLTRLHQVLSDLRNGKTAHFNIYDWKLKKNVQATPIEPNGIILVEGICSLDNSLFSFYDYKIWVDCSPQVGLERALKRDKGANKELWEQKWIPETVIYINEQKPKKHSDIVISNTEIPLLS
jgi:uridine kinase